MDTVLSIPALMRDHPGMSNLGCYIRKHREALNLRQEAVADEIGRNQSWYSRLENGDLRSMPEPETLRALADVLKVLPADLLQAAGYLTREDREHVHVNPFDKDDPRWALVETLKGYDLTADQAGAVRQVITLMAGKSQAE